MADRGQATKFTSTGYFLTPEGGTPAPTAIELTLGGTGPAVTAGFDLTSNLPIRELALTGTALAASASFDLGLNPPAEITLDGAAPAAGATFDVGSLSLNEVTLGGESPAAIATFQTLVPADITLQGEAPAAGATFDASWLSFGQMSLEGAAAPPAVGTFNFVGGGRFTLNGVAPMATATITLQWQFVPKMRLEVLDPTLGRAPTVVVITLVDAFPTVPVTVSIDGVAVTTLTPDSDGYIEPTSIEVDETHLAGSHTIAIEQAGAQGASATFTLRDNPSPGEAWRGQDVAPVDIPEAVATPVRRWVLQDPLPGGLGSYAFPINPKDMSLPMAERQLEVRHTTAVEGGRFHAFEGSQRAVEWSFSGYCPTREMHDQLVAYAELKRRIYVIDHRGRAWKVALVGVEMVARKRQREDGGVFNDWAHDYTVRALLYDQDWLVPA